MGRSLDLLVLWLIKKIPQLRVKSLNFYDLLFRTTGQRVSRFFFGFRRTKSQASIYIRRFLLPKKTKKPPNLVLVSFFIFQDQKKNQQRGSTVFFFFFFCSEFFKEPTGNRLMILFYFIFPSKLQKCFSWFVFALFSVEPEWRQEGGGAPIIKSILLLSLPFRYYNSFVIYLFIYLFIYLICWPLPTTKARILCLEFIIEYIVG